MKRRTTLIALGAVAILGACAAPPSRPSLPVAATYPEYRVPDDLAARRATVLSEGTPLIAHVLQPRSKAGERLPTIILCQGTGGLQHYHLAQAFAFARAGFTAITFDYRGWGESRGRLVPVDMTASPRRDMQPQAVEAMEVRETVDPAEQTRDVMAMIAWAAGEPETDAARIGLWGTSLGAAIAAEATILEPRVRAAVLQVGPYDLRQGGAAAERIFAEAGRRARGDLPYPRPAPRIPGALHGHRVSENYQTFSPLEDLTRLAGRSAQPAILVIDAEYEELFDNRQHGQRFFERLRAPKDRVIIPWIKHYDIYRGDPLRQAVRHAVDWYERHLK